MVDDPSRQDNGLRAVPTPRIACRGVEIAIAPRSRPPFDVGAVAFEEDTYCVLSADTEVREPDEHPIRLWNALHELEPAAPGSVVVKNGAPPRFLAIVHDLSSEPTWNEARVADAIAAVLAEAERRGIARLGLQPLGGVHGKLCPGRFAALLDTALKRVRPRCLERLWLIPTEGAAGEWERGLAAAFEAD